MAKRIVEKLIRQQVDIGEMQSGFILGSGGKMKKKEEFALCIRDMGKAFDLVPKDVVWWALRKLGLEEWLVKIVQSMHMNAQSHVRVNGTFSADFLVQFGLHQGSVLSFLLFIIVLEALSREIRPGCPKELLCADDLALVSETFECLKGRLEAWTGALVSKVKYKVITQ